MNIGVIGSHVVDKLVEHGHEVTVFDIMKLHRSDVCHIYIDILDLSKTCVALTGAYDAVYMLAAMTKGEKVNEDTPLTLSWKTHLSACICRDDGRAGKVCDKVLKGSNPMIGRNKDASE